ncbi:hypothetical protein NOL18_13340 [Vibrio parahaemolyticus]|uniref:hypothetical protein n=1 Tax=Vibrio parahaemolyticus TaxID=670 RepID=UPI00226ACF6E|nr:hypothetical protein [Vibrio parahaemolyticus]MCX8878120.1 hypothetical protein [Vibrio parahaemolyticus]
MSRYIFNDQALGQYDFGFQQIQINSDYTGKTAADIEDIIKVVNLADLSDTELEIYKTYKHETTHLLDCTSTLWGMEYTCRMYNWFSTQSEEYLKVISLNDAEIQMHSHLLKVPSKFRRLLKLKYSLEHDESCGVFVHIHYLDEYSDVIQSTPITMLSLLEGHAYAQEQLLSCELYDKEVDIVSSALLSSKVSEDIGSLNCSEYSCFLALINQLFPELKLRQQLLIMILISRFSLNTPTFFIGSFSEYILRHIFHGAPEELISTLKMEMSRGMHRSSLCLVLLLCLAIHSETTRKIDDTTSLREIENILLKVYQRKDQSIDDVKNELQTHYNLEFELLLELLEEKGAYLAHSLAIQFKDKDWYFDDFSALELPDFFLSNGDLVKPCSRLDFNSEQHLENKLDIVVGLEQALKELGVARQHLYPSVYHDWLDKIKSGEVGVTYYPDASNGL